MIHCKCVLKKNMQFLDFAKKCIKGRLLNIMNSLIYSDRVYFDKSKVDTLPLHITMSRQEHKALLSFYSLSFFSLVCLFSFPIFVFLFYVYLAHSCCMLHFNKQITCPITIGIRWNTQLGQLFLHHFLQIFSIMQCTKLQKK